MSFQRKRFLILRGSVCRTRIRNIRPVSYFLPKKQQINMDESRGIDFLSKMHRNPVGCTNQPLPARSRSHADQEKEQARNSNHCRLTSSYLVTSKIIAMELNIKFLCIHLHYQDTKSETEKAEQKLLKVGLKDLYFLVSFFKCTSVLTQHFLLGRC